jgi:hypothetical protein
MVTATIRSRLPLIGGDMDTPYPHIDSGKAEAVRKQTSSDVAGTMVTTRTGDVVVEHSNGNCNDQPCKWDGGCAGCNWITAYLPLASRVLTWRYYSNAGGPNGDLPRPVQVSEGKHDSWSEVYRAEQFTTPTNTIVRFKLRNWSHNRDRVAALEVDYIV